MYWITPPAQDVFAKETAPRMYNPAPYERDEKEEKLRKELDVLRRHLWAKEVGPGKMITPQSIWPTKLLTRMVNLAHYGKLQTMEDLRKQTPWFFIDDIGVEILAKIQEFCPPAKKAPPPPSTSPFVSTPLAQRQRVFGSNLSNTPFTFSAPATPTPGASNTPAPLIWQPVQMPVPTDTSSRAPTTTASAATSRTGTRVETCSRCHQQGHRCEY